MASPTAPLSASSYDTKDELKNIHSTEKGKIIDEDAHLGTASLPSSYINMLKTIIGAGIISLPVAIKSLGYITSAILMIVSALASFYGLYLYEMCASRLGRKATPFAVASLTYPKAGNVLDVAIVLKCLGVGLAYILVVGKTMAQFYTGLPNTDPNSVLASPRIWILIFMAIMVPLSFFKRMDHLKYSSFLGLASVFYLIVLSIVTLVENGPVDASYIKPFGEQFRYTSLSRMGIFVFAFTCHQNLFPIHNETKKNSTKHITMLCFVCIAVSFVVYTLYGYTSYLCYADVIQSNTMFSVYPTSQVAFQIARVLFAFLLSFSYPLQVLPFRNSFLRLLCLSDAQKAAHGKSIFVGTTLLMICFTFGVSMSLADISAIIGLVGAVTSSVICYILPSIFYLKLTNDRHWDYKRICAVTLCGFGILVFFVGTISGIWVMAAGN